MTLDVFIPISDITYLDKNRKVTVYNSKKQYGYYDNTKDLTTIKNILETKRPVVGEIELTLFEWCPINCSFCHHDKKSTVGLSRLEILSKLDIIENFVKDRHLTVEVIQINMVGGELFADEIIDEFVLYYIEFIDRLVNISKKYDVKIDTVWVSNFLFTKTDKILNLLQYCNDTIIDSSLICSYDFSGRPTNKQYFINIRYFEDYISSINIVATTDTILDMMKMDDLFFSKYLYNTFEIYIDDFIPDESTDHLIPSDSMLLSFYKFIYHTFPEANPVKELVTNDMNKMHCLSLNKITIFPDNSTSNCKWHRYKPENYNTYNDTEINYVDNAPQMQTFMDENECLSCEFFNKCGFRCYTQYDWTNRTRDLSDCMMKMFFRYIEKDINI